MRKVCKKEEILFIGFLRVSIYDLRSKGDNVKKSYITFSSAKVKVSFFLLIFGKVICAFHYTIYVN